MTEVQLCACAARFWGEEGARAHSAGPSPRRPRSRRQLQQLTNVDNLIADDDDDDNLGLHHHHPHRQQPESASSQDAMKAAMLSRLRGGALMLQLRVTDFLNNMDTFNRQSHKSGLDHILETS